MQTAFRHFIGPSMPRLTKVFSEALASYVRLFTEVLERLSEKPHERAKRLSIRRLMAT